MVHFTVMSDRRKYSVVQGSRPEVRMVTNTQATSLANYVILAEYQLDENNGERRAWTR
jgi:hypothetical protein